jgi:hypothetical protein
MHNIYGGSSKEGVGEEQSSFTVCNPSRQTAGSTKKQKTQTKPREPNPVVVEMHNIYGGSRKEGVDEEKTSFTVCNPSHQKARSTKKQKRDTNPAVVVEMHDIYGGISDEGVGEEKTSFTMCNPSRQTAGSTKK